MNSWALQQAIYTRLSDQLSVEVYDHVPQDAAYPYVTIGEGTESEWDTDDSLGIDATINIHVWSRYRGRKEVKQLQDQIYAALHRYDLPVSGADTVLVNFEFADSFVDPDGLTRHGVQRFRIITEDT